MRSLPRVTWIAFALVTAFGQPQPSGAWRRLLPPGTHLIPARDAKSTYSVLISTPIPSDLKRPSVARIKVNGSVAAEKSLHAGDPDLYTLIHGGAAAAVDLLTPSTVQVMDLGSAANTEAEPNNGWESANPISLGAVVWGSGDEAPYIPAELGTRIKPNPHEDWFRFDWQGSSPQLLHLSLEVPDRDNIPIDVSLHQVAGGKLREYSEGEDPVTLPHEVQALPGNKFTTRILRTPGTYFVRVKLTHPFYRLRTRLYDAPPYKDPRKAVQAAVDYLIGAGDSWHANTPRRGGLFNRVASNHQETTLCVACHATHFTQRGQLYALRNGYEVNYPDQLAFLAERFYNNPRPLYGFEEGGAVWARVISASANVLSRMSHLLGIYENELTHDPRPEYHRNIAEYLKLYYKDRAKLPGDETNGNTPLVSTYEVAWYSWEVTRAPAIAVLIEQDHEIKNTIDLCYQTLALAAIDRVKHSDKIARNAEKILSLQRSDGQWSARFDPQSFAVEFQTGHALWALHAAGISRDHPGVAKGLAYLLGRQQPFGGWLDPLQTYENFRTPFRETQMVVLALSAYYPQQATGSVRWGTKPVRVVKTLEDLNAIWENPGPDRLREIEALTAAPEPMLRAQALETLGRLGRADSAATIARRLDDPSKIVMRAAALALRQIYSRRPEASAQPLLNALQSSSERERWAATRVFATHASALGRRTEFADSLARRMTDQNPAVAIQAIKGAWQYWYWTPSTSAKETIEDAVLSALDSPRHDWVERNLKEAVYNIADENIRYLYNNWVPGLANPADRERVIQGRLAIEDRLATKFARVLESGSKHQVKMLLAGIGEFELRRGDVYDPAADHSTKFQPIYNRIGNDVEQIVFFGAANDRMAKALAPYLASDDPETKRLALIVGDVLRDVNFGEVSRLAGNPTGERDPVLAAVKASRPVPQRSGGPGGTRARAGTARPDDDYFRGYVEPILTTRGKDGQACVHCHASHTIFNGTLTTAKNVINLDDPEASLILVKPTSTAETEGVVNSGSVAHGGGVRFDRGSPEYNTILNWIRGTKP